MAAPVLGRLERVNVREAWPGETQDFTPWLAREENITLPILSDGCMLATSAGTGGSEHAS